MDDRLSRFSKSDRGATAIEYGLIAAGIAVAIAGAVFVLGNNIGSLFGSVSEVVAPAEAEPEPEKKPQRLIDGQRGNAIQF